MPKTAEKIQNGTWGRAILAAAPGLAVAVRLFENVTDALFCIKDGSGRYVAANTAFAQHVGRKHPHDLLGHTAHDFFPPQLAAAYEAQDAEVLATGRGMAEKVELIFNSNGTLGWYVTQKEPVLDAAGRPIGVVGVSRDLRLPEEAARRVGVMAAAVESIRRNFRQPLRAEALARTAGLSLDTFERRFRKLTGITAREFLLRVRLEEAALLLRSTQRPLASIAFDCGFYDQSSFTRHFRRAAGLTPSAYRRSV